MKRLILLAAILVSPLLATAQAIGLDNGKALPDSVFIAISDDNVFSKCFTNCDLNNDGFVSYAEAKKATKLYLDYGGRKNIISDYSFLKHFPNLTEFSIGNTPVESIDLSVCPKLEKISLRNGLWVKTITISHSCTPQFFFPFHDDDIVIKRVRTDKF